MRDLRGEVVVVTGAGSGIGKALARGLCAKGAHLALVDVDESSLGEIATELNLLLDWMNEDPPAGVTHTDESRLRELRRQQGEEIAAPAEMVGSVSEDHA